MSGDDYHSLRKLISDMDEKIMRLELETKILRMGIAKLSMQDIDILTAARDRNSADVEKAYEAIKASFTVTRVISDFDRNVGEYPDDEGGDE
tara:strand:- start:524 stop:799 length:276 start_codon:yes stop_codon:yes gene_type:complete